MSREILLYIDALAREKMLRKLLYWLRLNKH